MIFDPEKKEAVKRLGFLYKKSAMSNFNLTSWLVDDEFFNIMIDLVNRSKTIDNEIMLRFTRALYIKRIANREKYPDFNLRACRSGIRQLERALGLRE